MRPKKRNEKGSGDLFRARLDQIIDMKHELVRLAEEIDWDWIDEQVAESFSAEGRPGTGTRFMIGILLLKQIYGLSDEGVWERWVHDPYFQHFTGETYFQHKVPHERSGLSHWRGRLGEKLELLLAESLRVAHATGALKARDMERVTVDTTVQPKNITHPTDTKLMHKAIVMLGKLDTRKNRLTAERGGASQISTPRFPRSLEHLLWQEIVRKEVFAGVQLARKHGVKLRQSYVRVAKQAAIMAGRYAHAKQWKRQRRQLKFLRTRLGRLIRDIRRKIEGDAVLKEIFAIPLTRATQVRSQQQRQRGWKLYSLHAPEVECIAKAKAHKPYEFGCKVSITTTNARSPGGQFVLHAKAFHGRPYDGHTLGTVITETQALTGVEIKRAYVDKGYVGHNAPKPLRVYRSGQKRGVHGQIKKELRRRAAIEPVIGHLKSEGHLARNYLKGRKGDHANAVLTATGHNFRLVLRWLRKLLTKLIAALNAIIWLSSALKTAS